MAKISVLPQELADKIAAGEVAERPSSVVKELVENAIDAGAGRIEVEIKKGGIAYIRVTDNGSGIPGSQVETAFLRHATSKLSTLDDLYRIGTMGFRGEALSSISAVAEMEVITKTADEEEGTYLKVEGGLCREREEMTCADGTTMMVKNLFANVPARMKFLKRDSTEAGYVTDLMGRIALSRSDIAFRYLCDGKEIFSTTGDGNLKNVVLNVYGVDHAKALLDADYTEEGIRVSGVVGKPEISRGNRTRQTLLVNGRYIKNHVVSKVVEEAYRNYMMVGKFPFFVLNITLPFEMVDVNVHPAKTEVKFAEERRIYEIVNHAVKNALYQEKARVPKEKAGTEKAYVMPETPRERAVPLKFAVQNGADTKNAYASKVPRGFTEEYLKNTMPGHRDTKERGGEGRPEDIIDSVNLYEEMKKQFGSGVQEDARENMPGKEQEEVQRLPQDFDLSAVSIYDIIEDAPEEQVEIVGQIFDTYIICRCGDAMYMVDQHAAHERLRFEKLKKAYQKKERFAQVLMVPAVVNLGAAERATVLENLPVFRGFGFEIEDFGGNSLLVHESPLIGSEEEIRDLILEIAESAADSIHHPIAEFEERALDMIACKYAIKANKKLTAEEMRDLMARLKTLEDAGITTCPHGRPIKITFTKDEIEKMFKRKV